MAQIEARFDDTIIVVWRDGEIAGDARYVKPLYIESFLYESTRLGPPEGPYSEGDHLLTALGFCLLANRILPEGTEYRGDLPADRESTDDDGVPLL